MKKLWIAAIFLIACTGTPGEPCFPNQTCMENSVPVKAKGSGCTCFDRATLMVNDVAWGR